MQLQQLKHKSGMKICLQVRVDELLCTRECVHHTLRYLSSQRGGDSNKVQVSAAVVDRHLSALAEVIGVGVALSHEQIERKASVHQYSCSRTRE